MHTQVTNQERLDALDDLHEHMNQYSSSKRYNLHVKKLLKDHGRYEEYEKGRKIWVDKFGALTSMGCLIMWPMIILVSWLLGDASAGVLVGGAVAIAYVLAIGAYNEYVWYPKQDRLLTFNGSREYAHYWHAPDPQKPNRIDDQILCNAFREKDVYVLIKQVIDDIDAKAQDLTFYIRDDDPMLDLLELASQYSLLAPKEQEQLLHDLQSLLPKHNLLMKANA